MIAYIENIIYHVVQIHMVQICTKKWTFKIVVLSSLNLVGEPARCTY